MAYNFKKLSEVEKINSMTSGASVLIEDNGEVKRAPNWTGDVARNAYLNTNKIIQFMNAQQKSVLRCIHHDNFCRADNPAEIGENSLVADMMKYETVYHNTSDPLRVGILGNVAYAPDYATNNSRTVELVNADGDYYAEAALVEGNPLGFVIAFDTFADFTYIRCDKGEGYVDYKIIDCVDWTTTQTAKYTIYGNLEACVVERVGDTIYLGGGEASFVVEGISKKSKIGLFFGSNNDFRCNGFAVYHRDTFFQLPFGDDLEENHADLLPLQSGGHEHSVTVVNDVVNGSNSALRFELRKSDNISNVGSKRSELVINTALLTGNDRNLNETWSSFDVYFPEDYAADSSAEIFYQVHDEQEDWDAVPAHSPCIAMYTRDDKIWLGINVCSDKNPAENRLEKTEIDLGAIPKGRWINVIAQVKSSYDTCFPAMFNLKIDGRTVAQTDAPNSINAVRATYQKIGIYKWDWVDKNTDVDTRVVYFDNLLFMV